jgi:excisionase family DNA binding protein
MSKFLSYKKTAEVLGTTPRHVRDLTREHGLPFVRVGRLIRIDADDLAAWIAANRHGDRP